MEPPHAAAGTRKPIIALTTDLVEADPAGVPLKSRVQLREAYVRAVHEAGGVPVLLPPVIEAVRDHVRLAHAFVFVGGDDLRCEAFGKRTHPKAQCVHATRQAYETALLEALQRERPAAPVLGVCLGMQLMAMHAGGDMDQYLPESLATADRHREDRLHPIEPVHARAERYGVVPGSVASSHKQAVTDPGRLCVLAKSDDGLIEAVADVDRMYYVGVQWHPERTPNQALGVRIFERLIRAAREGALPPAGSLGPRSE